MFKRIKSKLEKLIWKYAQKNIDELSRIINRPKEGEIVKINSIKIRKDFNKPNPKKLERKREYYEKYQYFKSPIVLTKNNFLVDGYTTYLLAKEKKFDYITILRKK